jgi:hypothetical protein
MLLSGWRFLGYTEIGDFTTMAQVLTEWMNAATLVGVVFFLIKEIFSQYAMPC